MESNPGSSSRADRKIIEKNRRNQMKALYSMLISLVPHDQNSRESVTLPDQLDEAAKYIKKLQVDVERMKERKNRLMGIERLSSISTGSSESMVVLEPPQIDVHDIGSALQVVSISGLDYKFMLFTEMIRVLHEEGVEIINATFSAVDDTIFHTVHCKAKECATSCADAGRICKRLKKLVNDAYSGY